MDKKYTCPACRKSFQIMLANDVPGVTKPKAGDAAFCTYCNTLLQFTTDDTLELADWNDVGERIRPVDRVSLEKEMRRNWNARCPQCESPLDAHTPLGGEDRKPVPGDLSLCLNCGALLEFEATDHLIPLSDNVFNSLPQEAQQLLVQGQEEVLRMQKSAWDS